MAGDALLRRIDEHMARGNEVMDEIRAEVARSRRSYEDQLQITREVIRRNELVLQDFRKGFHELVEQIRELTASTREVREESRAHSKAIFALIDRLGGGGAPAVG